MVEQDPTQDAPKLQMTSGSNPVTLTKVALTKVALTKVALKE